MFNNIEELKKEILLGKSNEQIIHERIKFLNSEEYKNSRLQMIERENQKLFYDGFINSEEETSWSKGLISDVKYTMDENEIFNYLIDSVRNNIDVNGFNMGDLIKIVRDYFDKPHLENEQFIFVNYIKKYYPNDQEFIRYTLPCMMFLYKNRRDFKGSLEEFAHGYLAHEAKTRNVELDKYDMECYAKFNECVDVNILDEEELSLPISSIKGTGIARCTEYALLTQNCLAFLGYETYLLGGTLTAGKFNEEHNYNVIKRPSGDGYALVDTAQYVLIPNIPGISTIDDVKNMTEIRAKRYSNDATEVSYTTAEEIKTKSRLQQKEEELSSLEAEARKISETEALIDKQKVER